MELGIKFLMGLGAALSILIMVAVGAQTSKSDGFGAGLGSPGGVVRGNRQDELLARLARWIGIGWALCFLLLALLEGHRQ